VKNDLEVRAEMAIHLFLFPEYEKELRKRTAGCFEMGTRRIHESIKNRKGDTPC